MYNVFIAYASTDFFILVSLSVFIPRLSCFDPSSSRVFSLVFSVDALTTRTHKPPTTRYTTERINVFLPLNSRDFVDEDDDTYCNTPIRDRKSSATFMDCV